MKQNHHHLKFLFLRTLIHRKTCLKTWHKSAASCTPTITNNKIKCHKIKVVNIVWLTKFMDAKA